MTTICTGLLSNVRTIKRGNEQQKRFVTHTDFNHRPPCEIRVMLVNKTQFIASIDGYDDQVNDRESPQRSSQLLAVSRSIGSMQIFTIGRWYSDVAVLTVTTRTRPSKPG